MNDTWPHFDRPDQQQLAQRAVDLLQRAKQVHAYGWDEYRCLWSSGEVLGVALVLGDDTELRRCGETTGSALDRWAFTLWGITGGQEDCDAGLPRTRAWFGSLRIHVDVPSSPHLPNVTR